MPGSISLLVESPLQDLMYVMRDLPTEVKRQITRATKAEAEPIWFEELRARANTRLQQRVLVDTRQISVTARNIKLISARRGKLSGTGTPVSTLASAVEYGMRADRPIKQKSRKGTQYTRRAGEAFGPAARKGHVVGPAAADSIPRFVSLMAQTTVRCVHESVEKVS